MRNCENSCGQGLAATSVTVAGTSVHTFADAMLCLSRLSITEMPICKTYMSTSKRRLIGLECAPLMSRHLAPALSFLRSAGAPLVVGQCLHVQEPLLLLLVETWRSEVETVDVIIDCNVGTCRLCFVEAAGFRVNFKFGAQAPGRAGITRCPHNMGIQGPRDQARNRMGRQSAPSSAVARCQASLRAPLNYRRKPGTMWAPTSPLLLP